MNKKSPMNQKLKCNVIDAGARYGLHPTWKQLHSLVNFDLFEMESEEAARLEKMYAEYPNINVHACALFKSDCTLKYRLRKHKGLISIYDNNTSFLHVNNYLAEGSEYEEEREVCARSIDSMFAGKDIHFFKIDTEGAELDVLKGAEAKLKTTVLGVRAEVHFEEVCKDIPLFGDIHAFMQKNNFMLLNMDYDGRGHSLSRFTMPDRYGYLIDTEAIWIKKIEHILEQGNEKLPQNVVFLALFLIYNNATDIGIDLLLRAKSKKIDFSPFCDDPIFSHLKKQIAFLFKDLLFLPSTEKRVLYATYARIFDDEFPKWNKFYETFVDEVL
jgi:FkbM family methyltransferase